ncbi:dna repair dds20 mei5 protein [Rutstroemia sp. NJR-2017a BBW]|nr:dna repair dds20 mei5 protein [Rutstroemia sp. NJR-2017a BBW]PQE08724.1 dna repair dds20 mei5 protein [Rutstroemia sp. NJR-2017a BBW]
MSTPAAKRRRIEAANSTLQKPFRSPFKTPFKSPLLNRNSPNTPASASGSTSTPSKPVNSPLSLSTPVATPIALASRASAVRGKKTLASPVSSAALNADPDIAPLVKMQRDLERQLKEVKQELEVVEQARKIERDSGEGEIDGELVRLCEKWREASRGAAEELFGKVRDRVNRMGGPRAWKEMQKRQQEFQNQWDQDDVINQNQGDEDDEDAEGKHVEKRDIYAEYDIDPETENEKSQRAPGLGDTGENPGEEDVGLEFTMAMMLRTLNVDLAVIGYDKQEQRWAMFNGYNSCLTTNSYGVICVCGPLRTPLYNKKYVAEPALANKLCCLSKS